MSKFLFAGAAAALSLLAACGGGTTQIPADSTPSSFVTVQGTLEARDDSTTSLAGVVVTCPETGAADVTDERGLFELHAPMQGSFHLDFDDPAWPMGAHAHGDHHEMMDPYPDKVEADGPGVTLLRPGGTDAQCAVEVYMDGGDISECYVSWAGGGETIREGERHLDRDPLCDEVDSMGEIEASLEDGCLAVEIEVDGFSRAASLDVYLEDATGAQAYVATMGIDEAGSGHLDLSWCEGDAMPFDASAPEALAGYAVVMYDEAGSVVFRSHLPHQHGDTVGDAHHVGGHMGADGPGGGMMGGGSR